MSGSQPYDGRSIAKQIVDNIDLYIRGDSSQAIAEMQVAGRMIKHHKPESLWFLRARYYAIYCLEQRQQRIAQGLGDDRNRFATFRRQNSSWPNGNW